MDSIDGIEYSYEQLLNELGPRPSWSVGLSARAAHALLRAGWDFDKLSRAISDGVDLTLIPNIGRRTAAEIITFFTEGTSSNRA